MDSLNNIEVILASTVIAAIISGLVTVYLSKRKESLEYITGERQKWREEIRKIAEEISDSSEEKMKEPLARLKVRINAYGKYEESYMKDSHIWRLIEKLEKPGNTENTKNTENTENAENAENLLDNFETSRDKLVYSLSLLLKYDWDRQKREVEGYDGKKWNLFFLISLAVIVFFAFNNNEKGLIICSIGVFEGIVLNIIFIIDNIMKVREMSISIRGGVCVAISCIAICCICILPMIIEKGIVFFIFGILILIGILFILYFVDKNNENNNKDYLMGILLCGVFLCVVLFVSLCYLMYIFNHMIIEQSMITIVSSFLLLNFLGITLKCREFYSKEVEKKNYEKFVEKEFPLKKSEAKNLLQVIQEVINKWKGVL